MATELVLDFNTTIAIEFLSLDGSKGLDGQLIIRPSAPANLAEQVVDGHLATTPQDIHHTLERTS